METSIGIRFKDHVLVASSGSTAFYYMELTPKEDKVAVLDKYKVAAATGGQGDRTHLFDYIRCSMKAQQVEKGQYHTTTAVANFLRLHMAESLRSRGGMYQVNCMVAGYDVHQSENDADSVTGPSLYWVDYLAAMNKVNFGAHGYGGSFVTAVLDRHWKEDMSYEDSLELMKACIKTVVKRLVVKSGKFIVKVVTKDGVKVVDLDE
ncbi:Proteasome subunit beta type-2 [Diplonema papillatum]|nr:Proteasome subunit beta type-2 [Diplonema papillatum]